MRTRAAGKASGSPAARSSSAKLTGPQMSAAAFALFAISEAFRRQYKAHRRNPFMDAVRARMVELARAAKVRACRFCGCTERTACLVTFDVIEDEPQGCSWIAADCCSAPACRQARDRESDAIYRNGGRRGGR